MTNNNDCLIAYLEARRDQAGFNDAEWEGATAVIDWLKSQFEWEAFVRQFPKGGLMKTDQEKLDSWMSLCIEQREEIARMRAALIEIRLHVKQAGGNARLRPRFLMDVVKMGLGEGEE